MFRYNIETLRFIQALLCVKEKQNSNVQQKLYYIFKKECNIRFFMNESKKQIAFNHKKTKR
jgi:hypothetical protein